MADWLAVIHAVFDFMQFSDFCRVLLGYLVHHGYTATAVQFAKSTGLELGESVESIKNRQSMRIIATRTIQ